MKKIFLITLALLATVSGLSAKSYKRGVSENNFMFVNQLELLEPGVSWYYNWGNTPGSGYKGQIKNDETLEYVPMAWNANYNEDNIRAYCKEHKNVKYLLGFNEPNFTAQANMTPAAAAEAWPRLKALADELGLKLVAPALNYSPNPPYTNPVTWMDEFVALVGKDAFDFVALHNYGGTQVMKDLCTTFHNRYGKDVWVTEFCYWPGEGNNTYVSPKAQIATMVEALRWLETTPWIYRYAWFKATGSHNADKGPNYGLLVPANPVTEPWSLSEQGLVYTYLPDFNPDSTLPLNENQPAVNYLNGENMSFGSGYDPKIPDNKLIFTDFANGSFADYRFDVDSEGTYGFVVRVSGYGEPTRFDPTLVFSLVDEEGNVIKEIKNTGSFELPNSDDTYYEIGADVELTAGKHIIRVSYGSPLPSGLRMSAVRLVNITGVDDVAAETDNALVDVTTLQGIIIKKAVEKETATEGLTPGIYIIGGKKVIL